MVHKFTKIAGRKVLFNSDITADERKILEEFVKEKRNEGDWHFWKSDSKVRFQQFLGKEYYGWIYEFTDLKKKQFKSVM